MNTLAYNIDPLLQDPGNPALQALADAIPDLILGLPDFRHLAITEDTSLKIDWNSTRDGAEPIDSQLTRESSGAALPLELISLKVSAWFWENPASARRKSLVQALSTNSVNLWFTTNPPATISANGVKTILVSTAIQLLNRSNYPKKRFGKPGIPKWAGAAAIIVPHHQDRETLISIFPQLENTTHAIFPAFEEPVQPLTWSEQEQLKLRYSGGRDFFLYAGEISAEQELVHLLKAYSLVKKWLMTGMPLILAGPASEWTPKFEKMLLTYKYRSDVSVYTDLAQKELSELVAGAYALIHPAATTEYTSALQWAFSAGTPVIASESKEMLEFCREAAQLSPAGDIDQLAHAMMILYKDEYLRSNLITKGQERSSLQNRQNTLLQYKAVIMGLLGDNG